MMTIRTARDRGKTNLGWLESDHTFSFGDYHDPAHHHYRSLRVINDDRIAGGGGFPTHPHRDMEIITIMLAGRLAHQDSLGSMEEIRPGEVQVMTAGTGIAHSEFNPSPTETAHLLQVWILPERNGLAPQYAQKMFETKPGTWQVVASRDGREGSLVIHQDAAVAKASLTDQRLRYDVRAGRGVWLHVASGEATVNGQDLNAGDAVAIEGEPVTVSGSGEVLLFDLK
jgi:hypothetical protein